MDEILGEDHEDDVGVDCIVKLIALFNEGFL